MIKQAVLSKDMNYQYLEFVKVNRNKRHKFRQFFVEGVRNINAAIQYKWHICSFIYAQNAKLSRWATETLDTVKTDVNYELSAKLMADLSDKEDTSELVAIVAMQEFDFSQFAFSANPVLALFDRPSNRGNLGTILRSCDALGVEGLIITGHAVDLYDPDVIVSSTGSFFKVPVVSMEGPADVAAFVQQMKAEYPGFRTIGTTAHKQSNLYDIDMTQPLLFMIGNETDGLSRAFRDTSDVLATIPMSADSSASSLNVSCAAAVLFYEANRQRSRQHAQATGPGHLPGDPGKTRL